MSTNTGSWWARTTAVLRLAGLLSCGVASLPVHPQAAAGTILRSGFEDMGPALQKLQQDSGLSPAWLWIEQGRAQWQQREGARPSCADCHGPIGGMMRSAAVHPRWHEASRRPRTLHDQVRHCRVDRQAVQPHATVGREPVAHDPALLPLTAALVAAAQGQAIQPDSSAGMASWVERGGRIWHQRMGQLNLSCAQCHDQRAGQIMGGVRIPQGHDSGYPVYRMQWQALGFLERRLHGCMSGVRADPYAADADEWRALAAYMHRRSAGLPIEAGAIRP